MFRKPVILLAVVVVIALAAFFVGRGGQKQTEIVISEKGIEVKGLPAATSTIEQEDFKNWGVLTTTTIIDQGVLYRMSEADRKPVLEIKDVNHNVPKKLTVDAPFTEADFIVRKSDLPSMTGLPVIFWRLKPEGITVAVSNRGYRVDGIRPIFDGAYMRVDEGYNGQFVSPSYYDVREFVRLEVALSPAGPWREVNIADYTAHVYPRALPREMRGRDLVYVRFSEKQPFPENVTIYRLGVVAGEAVQK
ncbi:MAG: hypothetical protein PWP65_953 [Clostridia bacterium]|nr:hypothetical protein [Clostridia bacterium]